MGSITDLLKWFSSIKLFIFERKARNRVSGVRFQVSGFGCQVSGVRFRVSGFSSKKLRFFRDDAREKWPLKGHNCQVKKFNDKISRI